MRDSNGASRGSGFVAFKSAEEASRAVSFSFKYSVVGLVVISAP